MPTSIEDQARQLAKDNREAEPTIQRIFWLPSSSEIRLIEVMNNIPSSGDEVQPFYFQPDPGNGLTVPSGIVLIRPDEVRKVKLPAEWGTWDNAQELN